ncbi:hypothetical protein AMAG_01866 [Allomyces macrogynus ATCC 38327]|uniref:Fatty acid desaturase domain-containing protein n=1 Tax=Allomyces macrogynus (strain ATCC 38327) TaxID=578462 RepID=A0A0L0S0G0_ALLM3|nr:hypothetical protein AMAG_01866 [Allomyces macrogynus ATCC 38327]|eukprot:KNE56023.1 hypothetical protein AMAG_01866 [Allomyces macrogynus ATCC 38327]
MAPPATISDVANYTLSQRRGGGGTPATAGKGGKAKHATPARNADKVGYQPIDMSLKELRDAIPAHLFERSAFKSFLWTFHDLILAAALAYGAMHIDSFSETLPLDMTARAAVRWMLWAAYWVAQGIVCTGIWVIAHECGHQSFSSSKTLNNTVGYILHTALLVPYHAWRITHSKHHKATNHLTNDQVFVPHTRAELIASDPKLRERNASPDYDPGHDSLLQESPLFSLLGIVFMLTFGWPAYIINNTSGQKYPEYGWASHFFPSSPFFEPRNYGDIILSNIGVFGMLGLLGYAGSVFGAAAVVKFYLIPYLFVNMWLVIITFLQHTHPDLPHYSADAFTFLRGAIATVDRDYGILNYFFHNIADSHVVHHIWSTMPHYNAIKATEILREKLKGTPYYKMDKTPIAKAIWQSWTTCKFVEPVDQEGVYWFNN